MELLHVTARGDDIRLYRLLWSFLFHLVDTTKTTFLVTSSLCSSFADVMVWR